MRTMLMILSAALALAGCGDDKKGAAKAKKAATKKEDAATDKLLDEQSKKREAKKADSK